MKQLSSIANNILRFVVALFAACALNAQAQNNPAMPNSIKSLSFTSVQGGRLVLKVEMKNGLDKLPAGFTINTPPRIAFDFPNTENGLGKTTQEFGEGDLRSANIVQAGNRTRLVINLSQMLAYSAQIEGNNLLVTLQGKAAAAALTGAVAHFAEAKPSGQKHSLRDVDFHRGKNGEGLIQVDLSDSDIGIDIRQQGARLIVDFSNTTLPRNLQRKLDVKDFGTLVEGIDTFAQGDDARMVIEPKGQWEQAAYQTDNKFIVEIKPVAVDPGKAIKGAQVGYSGEKLTLNFQSISIREALYVISDFINSNNIPMNMVIDESVSGNLTLRLNDVPWDQALDIILNTKDLGMVKNGNVIQIAPRAKMVVMEKISLTAAQDNEEVQELHTESFQLNYATAEDIAKLLSYGDKGAAASSTSEHTAERGESGAAYTSSYSYQRGGRLLSKRGSAVADKRTNTVFVQDTKNKLDQIREIIKKIDQPVRQVLIEARFVEATETFNRTLGGKLGYSGPAVGTTGAGIPLNVAGGQYRALWGGNVNLPGASSGTGGLTLSLFDPLATRTLTLELSASEIDGTTKAIASPRVVTTDSGSATIKSGVQIPYTVTGRDGPTTQFKDATLSLTVTPQITPDDHVKMDLKVTQDTVGNMYGGVPSINSKAVDTQVLVENGGTVVIGGVYTQDETDSTQKVPLLGDIPVVGWLFKNNVKTEAKKELLIFITPKILKETLNLH